QMLAAVAAAAVVPASGQAPPPSWPQAELSFARLQYADAYRGGFGFGGRGNWTTDFPQAEFHFGQGVSRLTRIDVGEPVIVNLRDDALFDYPWLYAVEVGQWDLDFEEAAKLREYLLRGGFLMVDDFHGTREWRGFINSMTRVFPDQIGRAHA